ALPCNDAPIAGRPTLITLPSMKARLEASIVVASTQFGCAVFGDGDFFLRPERVTRAPTPQATGLTRPGRAPARSSRRDKQRIRKRPFFIDPLRLHREP